MATSSARAKPLKATCHCGNITIEVPHLPAEINECQCSVCRRWGAEWAYYNPKQVTIYVDKEPTRQYIWGDRELEFHFCATCGCVSHWKAIAEDRDEMGVNSRLMDPGELRSVNRKKDFEQLAIPLNAKDAKHADDRAVY